MTTFETDTAIPTVQLELARRRLCAQIANVLINAMAESNSTFEQLDIRMSRAPGFTKAYINELISFKAGNVKELAYVLEAMGAVPVISAERIIPQRPLVNRHLPISDIDDYAWLFESRLTWNATPEDRLVEVMDDTTTFHIGARGTFNPEFVLRWKPYVAVKID